MDFKKGTIFVLVISLILVIMIVNFTNIPVLKNNTVSLSDFFKVDVNTVYSYEGTSEYSHALMLQDVTNKDNAKQFNFKGYMTEGIGPIDLEGRERTFFISYHVYDDKVIREDENGKRIVLKTPLKEGTTWNTVVKINNQEYNAKSTITELKDIADKGESRLRSVVETKVNLGSQFNNNVYLEKEVYDFGRGLVYFEKPIYLDNHTSMSFNYSLINTMEKEKFLKFIEELKSKINIQDTKTAILAEDQLIEKTSIIFNHLQELDWSEIANYVHEDKGLIFSFYANLGSPDSYENVFTKEQVSSMGDNKNLYIWGYDNSELAFKYKPNDYVKELLLKGYYSKEEIEYTEITYNDSVINSGGVLNTIHEYYPEAIYVEYYAPAPNVEDKFHHWQALRFVYEKVDKDWYLIAIVRDIHNP